MGSFGTKKEGEEGRGEFVRAANPYPRQGPMPANPYPSQGPMPAGQPQYPSQGPMAPARGPYPCQVPMPHAMPQRAMSMGDLVQLVRRLPVTEGGDLVFRVVRSTLEFLHVPVAEI